MEGKDQGPSPLERNGHLSSPSRSWLGSIFLHPWRNRGAALKPPDNYSVHRKPYGLHQKLLDLISEFGKTGDTNSIYRNQWHFCTSTMKYQKQKSEKEIPFDIARRKIKYLGINLTKEVKVLYSENYTILKKEIKKDISKWKHIT